MCSSGALIGYSRLANTFFPKNVNLDKRDQNSIHARVLKSDGEGNQILNVPGSTEVTLECPFQSTSQLSQNIP
jgi:hypothetical protein